MTYQYKKCKLFDPNPRIFLTNQVKYVQIPLKIHINLAVMVDRLHCGYSGLITNPIKNPYTSLYFTEWNIRATANFHWHRIHGCFRCTVSSLLPANLQ